MKRIITTFLCLVATAAFAGGPKTDNSNHHNNDNSVQLGDFQGQQQQSHANSHSNAHSSTNTAVQATTGDATSSSISRTGPSSSRSSAKTGDSSASSNSHGGSSTSNGGSSHGGSSEGGSITDTSKSYAVALPMPLNVPNLTPATAMCALSEASGFAIGFNFLSKTGAKQVIDKLCVIERQAFAFEAQCKFRTGAAIRYWLLQELSKSEELREVRYDKRYGTEGNPMNEVVITNLGSELVRFLKEVNAKPWDAEEDLPAGAC